ELVRVDPGTADRARLVVVPEHVSLDRRVVAAQRQPGDVVLDNVVPDELTARPSVDEDAEPEIGSVGVVLDREAVERHVADRDVEWGGPAGAADDRLGARRAGAAGIARVDSCLGT